MIKLFMIFLVLISLCCCNNNKYDDSTNINFRVISDNDKDYVFELDDDDKQAMADGKGKLAKLSITNKGKDMVLLTSYKRTFIIHKWIIDKKTRGYKTHLVSNNIRKIPIKHNDSTIIYIPYWSEPDSLFCYLFWQRDSLGSDEVKFYNDKKGNLKYHSLKKIARGNILKPSYKIFENCLTIDDSISKKPTQ